MRPSRAVLPLALILFAAAFGGPARASATPMAAAQKSLAALKENRIEDFAAAMHPDALNTFRSLLIQVLDGAAKEGKEKDVLQLFATGDSVAAVKKLSPAQFYVSFVRGVMSRQPELKETTEKSRFRLLGQVAEGPVTHVAYRMSMRVVEQDIVIPGVISLKKHGADWKALLTGDVEGMAQVLAQRFSAKGGPPPEPGQPVPTLVGQVKEGKTQVHLVVRWVTPIGKGKVSKMSAHSVGPKDPAWKLLGNRATLQRHLAKNYGPL